MKNNIQLVRYRKFEIAIQSVRIIRYSNNDAIWYQQHITNKSVNIIYHLKINEHPEVEHEYQSKSNLNLNTWIYNNNET